MTTSPSSWQRVEGHDIQGPGGPLRLRIDRPPGDGPWPILLYFPGGGFVDYVPLEPTCADLAVATSAVVVTVGYRLAPAHTFPAAHNDCLTALQYCVDHAESLGGIQGCIALAGDSAGGTLVAALTLIAPQLGLPQVQFQFLAYPLLAGASDTASRQAFPKDLAPMVAGWRAYAGEITDINPLLQPLAAKSLAGLPPALVITAERDPLCDEGELYAARLAAAGVPVTATRYAGVDHAFLTTNRHPKARNVALRQLGEAMNRIFASAAVPVGSPPSEDVSG